MLVAGREVEAQPADDIPAGPCGVTSAPGGVLIQSYSRVSAKRIAAPWHSTGSAARSVGRQRARRPHRRGSMRPRLGHVEAKGPASKHQAFRHTATS